MKIMTQDRETIIEQPRQVWVTPIVVRDAAGDLTKGHIMCSADRNPTLGEYESISRAKEVLVELFETQRRGEVNYYMPKK